MAKLKMADFAGKIAGKKRRKINRKMKMENKIQIVKEIMEKILLVEYLISVTSDPLTGMAS